MPANNSVKQNIPTDIAIPKFAKRSFLLISSSIIRLSAQLIIIFLFSRQLPLAAYGLYQSVWLYVNVMSVIALFGLPSLILSASVSSVRQWISENKIIFTTFFLLLNIAPLAYVLFAATEYSLTIKLLVIAITVIQNIAIVTETIAIKNKKEKLVLISNLIFSTGFLACHLFILYSGYSLQWILISITLLFLLKSLLLFWGVRTEQLLPAAQAVAAKQWFYLGLTDITGVIFKWLDKWLILAFISVTQFAMYFNGSYEIPIFGLMLSAVSNIMLVDMASTNKQELNTIKSLFEHSSLLLASVVFPSFCFLFFYSNEFFTFIFSEKYAAAIPVFVVSIFVLPVRITNYTAVLQVNNRNDLIIKGALIDLLLAIVFMAILYPLLHLPGLAMAFVLSTYVQAGYYLWHTAKLLNKKISYFFPFKRLLFLLLLSATITSVFYYIGTVFTNEQNLLMGIIACAALIVVLLWYRLKKDKRLV